MSDREKEKTMFDNGSRTRPASAPVAAILAAGVALALALAACGDGGAASPSASSPASAEATGEAGIRTVLVFDGEPPAPSPSQASLHVGLEEGQLPQGGPREATVVTDEDCAPDAEGISHCRNVVQLDGGRTLVLRHHHDMTEVPCLAPGERVLLSAAARPS
jgi:hypothetical protein